MTAFSITTGIVLALLSWPASGMSQVPLAYRVEAVVEGEGRSVAIDARVTVHLHGTEDEIRLWLFADRWGVPPDVLDERTARWIYPGETSLGGIDVSEVAVDGALVASRREPIPSGRDGGGSDLLVPVEPGEPRDVEVRVRATLAVPDRFGRLGRAHGELALLAPWYPLVVSPDGAWAHDVPHHVTMSSAWGEIALLGEGDHPPAVDDRSVAFQGSTAYVGALLCEHVHHREMNVGGATVHVLGGRAEHAPPPADAEGMDGVDDLVEIDRLALMSGVASEVLDTLAWLDAPRPQHLTVVNVRSRVELAGHLPGATLVSDRLFQIFPLDVVREFHRRAFRRALFVEVAERAARGLETPADRGWSADLRSVVLLELDELRRSDVARRPEELLQVFSFHPAIDSLLYAPQITFEQAYFGAVDESDPFRDDPVRAREAISGGRRLLESARDALSPEPFSRFVAMLVRARRPARAALARLQSDADALLSSWLAYATLAVNYRLGEISSEPTDGGFRHQIEVIRDGDVRIEPVEVEVEDAGGHRVTGTWDGEGERGIVEIVTPEARSGVTIDPRHRLPQSAAIADGHPRADDATSQPFRLPILSAFALDLLLSEADFTGLVDFAIRQRYDLEHTVSIRLARSVARTGGRIRYIQGLGPKVHTNRRLGAVGGGLGLQYVEPGFGGSALGGWALELELSGSVDSRSYVYDPREGGSLAGTVLVSGTVREDGSFNLGVRGGVRAGWIVSAGLLNAFVFVVGGGFTAGPALNADLQSLGGRNVLRGFANDELLATGTVYGVLEHRFTAVPDLALNVLHLAWVREVQLAWWAGVGGAFGTTDGREAVLALEAGAGVRFHYEYGGIQPGLLALDVGVPISRFWDGNAAGRLPVGFYVSFDQYY